jgi:trk system potassium uptake protein TrkH
MRQLLRPHAVLIADFQGRPIPKEALDAVMGFLFVYVMAFAALGMGLAFLGLDFLTALSGAASALANLGPGLGAVIGPAGNFTLLPDPAKVLLMLGMVFGRIEMFPLLVLFVPAFWKQ